MKILQKYVLLAVLAGAILAGCREDDDGPCCDVTNPECPNYDPCFGKEQPNARFFTEDRLIWPEFGEYLWIHDSILKGGPVQFRSPFESPEVSHTWYVGSQVFNTPSVIRNFAAVQRPAFITVSHVVTYPVDSLCYPEATGRDSVVHTFYLIDYFSELLTIDNTFRGVRNNETDSFDFKLRALQNFTGIPARWSTSGVSIYLINFHNGQDSVRNDGFDMTNTHFTLTDGSIPKGMLIINPDDLSVEMNYTIGGNNTQFTFRGRVVPE